MTVMMKFVAIQELERRTERALEILEFIMKSDAAEGVHDNDLKRVYRALKNGARYEGMYRSKKD